MWFEIKNIPIRCTLSIDVLGNNGFYLLPSENHSNSMVNLSQEMICSHAKDFGSDRVVCVWVCNVNLLVRLRTQKYF